MSDIVDRLRDGDRVADERSRFEMREAADEIERLRARVASDYQAACYLRELVAPQCCSAGTTSGVLDQLNNFMAGQRDDLAECRRLLRAALTAAEVVNGVAYIELNAHWFEAARAAGGDE